MNDLEEFVGDVPERRRLIKKRDAVQVRVNALLAKALPLQKTVEMYNDMVAAIDKRNGIETQELKKAMDDQPQ